MRARLAIPVLQLADVDKNQEITGAEWEGFIASLEADESGKFDPASVREKLLMQAMDANGDGAVTRADLDQMFKALDPEASGVVKIRSGRGGRGEGRGRGGEGRRGGGEGRRGGSDADQAPKGDGETEARPERRRQADRGSFITRGISTGLLRNADADSNGEVTQDEWDAQATKLEADGLSGDKLLASLSAGASDRRSPVAMIDRLLGGAEGPNVDRLQELFTGFDANKDGTLQAEELQSRRGGRDRRGPRGEEEAPPKDKGKGKVY